MDRKPWDNRDSHREGFGGRREWNSDRSDRRFGDDRPRFSRDDRFGGDRPRFQRDDRFGGDRPRFQRDDRFGGDRPRFGGERRFGGDRPRGGRDSYSTKTGPRARAFNENRFRSDEDYAKRQTVKIDAEVAAFFPTAKDVNDALRLVIALTRKVKERAAEAAEEAQAEESLENTAAEESDFGAEDEAEEQFDEAEETVSEEEVSSEEDVRAE